MQKNLYMDKKSTGLGEIREKNKKVKRKNEGTVLLLCLTATLSGRYPSTHHDYGRPTRSL